MHAVRPDNNCKSNQEQEWRITRNNRLVRFIPHPRPMDVVRIRGTHRVVGEEFDYAIFGVGRSPGAGHAYTPATLTPRPHLRPSPAYTPARLTQWS